jgi:hypothetical protein
MMHSQGGGADVTGLPLNLDFANLKFEPHLVEALQTEKGGKGLSCKSL